MAQDEELEIKKDNNISEEFKERKKESHFICNSLLLILFIICLGYFGIVLVNKDTSISTIINTLLLSLFTLLFVVISFTYRRKNKGLIVLSSLLLIGYYSFGINNYLNIIKIPIEEVPNFQGKSLTSVMKWADKNKVTINQEYEYSDMILEYDIISQNVSSGTSLNKVKDIIVAVSEGVNPQKEIIVPSMISWKSERVLKYIKDNHLNNVIVEFVESDKDVDTVIEQNTSGNMKRNDELKLTFSYGEELGYDEVKLIDFTNMSKFEVEFYMKQHQLEYEFKEDFNNKIKRGFAFSQNKKAGESVKIHDEKIEVTISKGPKIKVPELTKMSISEITEWSINNKLKLNFSDKYDSEHKENSIISVNQEKGNIIEQGTVIEVVISRGSLKMPKFKSLDDFYNWANKYNINYEEIREFSESVPAGEVISYSYKKGEAIKNDDTIKVTISDGNKKTVPSLKGLSKSEAIKKLENVGLKYSFIYDKSNSVKKNYVISQSISAGSEISEGITITVTLSNGEKEESSVNKRKTNVEANSNKNTTTEKKNNNSNNSGSNETSTNNNSNNNTNTDSGNSSNSDNTPTPQVDTTPSCQQCTITGLKNIIRDNLNGGYGAVSGALRSSIQSQCPGVKVNISADSTSGKASGQFISGFTGGNTDSCSTVSITLAD